MSKSFYRVFRFMGVVLAVTPGFIFVFKDRIIRLIDPVDPVPQTAMVIVLLLLAFSILVLMPCGVALAVYAGRNIKKNRGD